MPVIYAPRNFLVVVASAPTADFEAELQARYQEDLLNVGIGAWVVVTSETPADFVSHMGISSGRYGPCMISNSQGFAGILEQKAWDWLKSKGPVYASQ